jgi:hypothetical protein
MTEKVMNLGSVPLPADHPGPIFIGGHHRSGTTLLRMMLNRHPRIACGPEGELLERTSFLAFHRYLEEQWKQRLHNFGFGAVEIDQGIAAFIDNFYTRYAIAQGKERWAEKTPKNVLRIAYLLRLFPNARFIHIIRDPRDVYCSVRQKARTKTPRWTKLTPERIARGWVQFVEAGVAWRLDELRYCELRYEQLVREPEETMRRVFAFLGEDWREDILQPDSRSLPSHEEANANRPVFTSSVNRWRRDLTADEVRTIEAKAGPLMLALGYPVQTLDEFTTTVGSGVVEE